MARRKRTMRTRVGTDWVYNENSYVGNTTVTVSPGVVSVGIFPLTVSQGQRMQSMSGTVGVAPLGTSFQSWAALAEGGKQRVFEVEGILIVDPATWNVGQSFQLGWRLLHQEINPGTGGVLMATGYSMWLPSANGSPAQHANAGFLKEGYLNEANISGTAITSKGMWTIPIRWKSQKGLSLADSRAVFLWVETNAGSITLRVKPRLRTRVQSAS